VRVRVRKRGKRTSSGIPAGPTEAAQLEPDNGDELHDGSGITFIEPTNRGDFEIENLIAAITPANRHEEISFGRPVGRELLP
jgi:antitoxin MazE